MKKVNHVMMLCLFLFCSLIWGDLSFAQPVESLNSVIGLDRGEVSVSLGYTAFQHILTHWPSSDGEVVFVNSPGMGLYFGLSDRVDLGVHYSFDKRPGYFNLRETSVNTRISFIEDRLTGVAGLGVLHRGYYTGYDTRWQKFDPQFALLFGMIFGNQITEKFGWNCTNAFEIISGSGDKAVIQYIFHFSPAFSSEIRKWALRPEIGLRVGKGYNQPTRVYLMFGISTEYRFWLTTKTARIKGNNPKFPDDFYKNYP